MKKAFDKFYDTAPIILSSVATILLIISIFISDSSKLVYMNEKTHEYEILILNSSTSEVVKGAEITIEFVGDAKKLEQSTNERGFVNFYIPDSAKDKKVILKVDADKLDSIQEVFDSPDKIASIIRLNKSN